MGDAPPGARSLPSENLDFLAMDAFTSDAVPLHLLTREAYQMYLRHLKPDGVLAVHISNRYLDLEPVVAQAMADIGWSGVGRRRRLRAALLHRHDVDVLSASANFSSNPAFEATQLRQTADAQARIPRLDRRFQQHSQHH